MCNSSRNSPTVSYSFHIISHFHQQCGRVLISLHPHQHLLLSILCFVLFYYGHQSGFEVVSHCDVGLLFPNGWCWAAFYVFRPLVNLPYRDVYSDPLSILKLCFHYWVVTIFLYILDIIPLSDMRFVIFLFYVLSFHFLDTVLWHKILNFVIDQFIFVLSLMFLLS